MYTLLKDKNELPRVIYNEIDVHTKWVKRTQEKESHYLIAIALFAVLASTTTLFIETIYIYKAI